MENIPNENRDQKFKKPLILSRIVAFLAILVSIPFLPDTYHNIINEPLSTFNIITTIAFLSLPFSFVYSFFLKNKSANFIRIFLIIFFPIAFLILVLCISIFIYALFFARKM
ncbi:MAG: hypothetical protein Q7S18_03410 [bacterium]|nr:hypothetical protein [bacterium]